MGSNSKGYWRGGGHARGIDFYDPRTLGPWPCPNLVAFTFTLLPRPFYLILRDYGQMSDNGKIPTSTKWTRDAVGDEGREAVDSVYQIICSRTDSQGTGFLLDNGYVVTNDHIVHNDPVGGIMAQSSHGEVVKFSDKNVDADRDLAILEPLGNLDGGLKLDLDANLEVGSQVSTWGYPLGHSGPSPLLSVGYLSGFSKEQTNSGPVKQLVVNGAFNDGNSGGPLFMPNEDDVIGIVVAKHAPFTPFQRQALQILAEKESGFQFEATDPQGNTQNISQAQIIANLMQRFVSLTQVMIGYAVDASELADLCNEIGINI